ncbi:MAG: ATP-binding cassette domain-containing protein [Bacteroidota bacterium]
MRTSGAKTSQQKQKKETANANTRVTEKDHLKKGKQQPKKEGKIMANHPPKRKKEDAIVKDHPTEKKETSNEDNESKKFLSRENPKGASDRTEIVVELSHLKKSFEGRYVLKDINLHVFKGENMVVLGKSGEGKSVMIKCMMRLLEPDSGTVVILGENVINMDEEHLNEVRKRVGFLFQSAALYDSMTVRENLEFPLRDLKKTQQEVDRLVEEVLDSVGLLDAIEKMPSELSGGMRKRIGLARTLILEPEIILYDEPTAGLDPVTAKEICELIVTVQKKYKASAIIITHDLECARICANRMVVLKDGECTNEGTFEELEKSNNQFVKAFFNHN